MAIEDLPINLQLNQSIQNLLSEKLYHPDSRHIEEAIGWTYRELYRHTEDSDFLRKAGDAFLRAEWLGVRNKGLDFGQAHYFEVVSEILTTLGDKSKLDSYFKNIIKEFPDNGQIPFIYAMALSELSDNRAPVFF
ncbi:MAG TPA: hypothetical protein VHO90_16260 [Bacteroidales bacterium]|nr:hypothetical protein [Bacteroidales bacterium]